MNKQRSLFTGLVIVLLAGLFAASGASAGLQPATPAAQAPAEVALSLAAPEPAVSAANQLILTYSSRFVCTAALPAGTLFYGLAAPIVEEATEIAIHNPNDFPVTLFKKAVVARIEDAPPATPGQWRGYSLAEDVAFRIDCDDIARLLTGNPSATFIGTYGIGVIVEGYVVIGVGPQILSTGKTVPYASLDVTAEYTRSSEVLKKDIQHMPYWRWWWWELPWRLGYAYNRLIPIQVAAIGQNLDCRNLLYDALVMDAQEIGDPQQRIETILALNNGRTHEPVLPADSATQVAPALVAFLGDCEMTGSGLQVQYALLSNMAPMNANPINGVIPNPVSVHYPWPLGRWLDLPLIIPQNRNIDLSAFFVSWHAQQWLDVAAPTDNNNIQVNMAYFFPLWCGLRPWWPWWSGGDCTDIGVGEGESLDIETVTPVRVMMKVWPPALN